MKTIAITFTALLAVLTGSADARAFDDVQLQRLALCQDTWLDWKDDAVRLALYKNYIDTQLDQGASDGAFVPKAATNVLGGQVTEVFPQSVGMGVGVSVTVNMAHASAKARIEQQLGKAMECATDEGVLSCGVELGAKKTVMLMTSQNGRAPTSLIGCFYFYQH